MTEPIDFGKTLRGRAVVESGDCRKWTVRDAVEDFLDAIAPLPDDQQPTQLILIARRVEGDWYATWDRHAGTTTTEAVGILERAKFDLLFQAETE